MCSRERLPTPAARLPQLSLDCQGTLDITTVQRKQQPLWA